MAVEQTAEVIIIGVGVIRASVAYHLAKLGFCDVLVLGKKATIGCGNTAKAAGGVIRQFRNDVHVKLSAASIKPF